MPGLNRQEFQYAEVRVVGLDCSCNSNKDLSMFWLFQASIVTVVEVIVAFKKSSGLRNFPSPWADPRI